MNKYRRATFIFILCLMCVIALSPAARAKETEEEKKPLRLAQNISGEEILAECQGMGSRSLFDGRIFTGTPSWERAHFTLTHKGTIGSLYIIFQRLPGEYQLVNNDTGESVTVGQKGYLHEFLDLEQLFGMCPTSVTVQFSQAGIQVNEVTAFSPGRVPDYVQIWEDPVDGETDLVLFSAHCDDEHLFFAGILPYYGKELGYQIQMVYFTGHSSFSNQRVHEMLNGLWAVGIRNYPIIGRYADFNEEHLSKSYFRFAMLGQHREEMIGFVTEQMRRFKPKVVVTHDFQGEYNHGMHKMMADLVANAVELSMDPEQYPESAEKWGVWDVPKTYIHLYQKNPIVLDWDQQLESFGMSAWQASIRLGLEEHKSQKDDFWWFHSNRKLASTVPRYSPCLYGLYRSTVGEDVEKNDFFENVTSYAQDRQAEADRLAEAERQQSEEEARRNEEEEARRRAEEAEKQKAAESAQIARDQAEAKVRAQAEAEAAEALRTARQQKRNLAIGLIIVGFFSVFAAFSLFLRRKNNP